MQFLRLRAATAHIALALTLGIATLAAPVQAPAQGADWAGAYVGLTVGQTTGQATLTSVGNVRPFGTAELDGALVGLTAGYAWQTGRWVFGPEVSLATGGASGRFTHPSGSAMRYDEIGRATAGLRLGYAVGDVLISATAGWAQVRTDFAFDTAPPVRSLNFEDTATGRYLGLSLDMALRRDWQLRAEWRRYDGLEAANPGATFPGGPPTITLSAAQRDYDRTEILLSVLRRF